MSLEDTPGRMDFVFTKNGSLALCNASEVEDFVTDLNHSLLRNTTALIFVMSETSMTFFFRVFKHGIKVRDLVTYNGGLVSSFGTPLKKENREDGDMSYLIFDLVSALIGKSFWKIPPDQTVTRYIKTEKQIKPERQGLGA